MIPTHRWPDHVPVDLRVSPLIQYVYQCQERSFVLWDMPIAKPKRPVEEWVSELARVVPHIAKALAQKHRSMESRVAALEKELGALKAQFRLEEEFDKKLAAEIADLEGDSTLPEDADPIDLLPTAEELRELLEE